MVVLHSNCIVFLRHLCRVQGVDLVQPAQRPSSLAGCNEASAVHHLVPIACWCPTKLSSYGFKSDRVDGTNVFAYTPTRTHKQESNNTRSFGKSVTLSWPASSDCLDSRSLLSPPTIPHRPGTVRAHNSACQKRPVGQPPVKHAASGGGTDASRFSRRSRACARRACSCAGGAARRPVARGG